MIGQDDPLLPEFDPRFPEPPPAPPAPVPAGGSAPRGDNLPVVMMGLGAAVGLAGLVFGRAGMSLSGGAMLAIGAMRYDWKQLNPFAGYGMLPTAKGWSPPLGVPGVASTQASSSFAPSFQDFGGYGACCASCAAGGQCESSYRGLG